MKLLNIDIITIFLLSIHLTDLDTILKVVASTSVIFVNIYAFTKQKKQK